MHTAETVGEALARIVDDVKRKQLDVTARHREAVCALKQARTTVMQLATEYTTLDGAIDAQLQMAKEILLQNAVFTKAKLKSIKQEQLAKAGNYQKTLKATVKAQQSILELTESVLKTHKNGSLLHSLQSGVRDCLETYCTLEPETLRPPYNQTADGEFVPNVPGHYKDILGVVQKKAVNSAGALPVTFKELAANPLLLTTTIALDEGFQRWLWSTATSGCTAVRR